MIKAVCAMVLLGLSVSGSSRRQDNQRVGSDGELVVRARSSNDNLNFSLAGNHPPVRSRSGKFFIDSRIGNPDTGEYIATIRNREGKGIIHHKYEAGIDGAWSSRRDALFINDRLGSTQIDCLMWAAGKPWKLASLTTAAEKGFIDINGVPRQLPLSERPGRARFALTCDGWTGSSIKADLDGETWSGQAFSYQFSYDIRTGLLHQLTP